MFSFIDVDELLDRWWEGNERGLPSAIVKLYPVSKVRICLGLSCWIFVGAVWDK